MIYEIMKFGVLIFMYHLVCGWAYTRELKAVIYSDVVLETAVLVSRPLEIVFWRSWSWPWY